MDYGHNGLMATKPAVDDAGIVNAGVSMRDRRMLESVIPYFEMENGELTYLELMPIELQFDVPVWRNGNPRFSNQHGIIERLAGLSAHYGTKIHTDERGYGIVDIS